MRPFRILGDAFVNMWRNKATTTFAVLSVTASLVILGIVFAIVLNINAVAVSAKTQFDTITVFIKDDQKEADLRDMVDVLEKQQGVKEVRYESREEALRNLKTRWKEQAYLLEGLETNPLPRSLIITLSDIRYALPFSEEVSKMKGVEEVRSYQTIVDQLLTITDAVKNSGSVIIFILIGVSIILIHNAIRMAVASRSKEISIMKFIGATDWYIRWPFFVEGILIGLIGAGVAYLIIIFSYNYVFELAQSQFFVMLSANFVSPANIQSDISFLFFVIGACVGALGALISTRRPLNA